MDLKTFITETLCQIVEGIAEAQKSDEGHNINYRVSMGNPGGNLISDGRRMHTRVDFDVAVAAESLGGGKGKIQVFAIGSAEAGGERKSSYANRVSFSVPVRLPQDQD
jgi:hypothetical protein